MEYFAHSQKNDRPAQTYERHVQNVTSHAKKCARSISHYCQLDGEILTALAGTVAFWHDLGKLDKENQIVLSGEKKAKILPKKHWDAGAALLNEYNEFAAIAVYSHHTGYPDFSTESIREERAFRVEEQVIETDKLLNEFITIHKNLLGAEERSVRDLFPKSDRSIFLRLLLSCVVDADHTDTATHYGNEPIIDNVIELRPAERLEKLNEYIASLSTKNAKKDERTVLRNEMYTQCRDADVSDTVQISSCGSPVGSGKTTAVIAHLLTQAQKRGLRRIFVILPFTNIIQQSVKVYRDTLVLPGENPEDVVAELHHRADFESIETRRFTSLWRAPIIVTTAASFFETLASNSPAVLRRLHELPGSAIFVDEAHAALPVKLLPIVWKWMNIYAHEWGCYWVLASGSLCRFWQIPEIAQNTNNKNVPEIVDEDLQQRLGAYENNRINYRNDLSPKTTDSVIEWVKKFPGPRLVIVNTVNNAAVIASAYKERFGREYVEHLSTALTPLDRDKTLTCVKNRLLNPNDKDWVLIATSCVEAGVDLSFRTGFRELGSLASLLQVSGRVNREGKYQDAETWTFTLADSAEINRNHSIKDAAEVLRNYFTSNTVISQELCTEAISDEIKLQGVSKIYKELLETERNLEFSTVESKFKVIEADTCLAVVDFNIAEHIRNSKIDWRELQKNSIQIQNYNLQKFKIPEILTGIFQWNLEYNDFLGYMAGILFRNNPKNYIT